MMRVVAQRVLALVPVMLIVTFGTFLLVSLVPGDPAQTLAGGETANPETVVEIRQQLHLDEPFVQQYARWLGDAVRLDLGSSLYTDESVGELVARRFPVTLSLAVAAMLVALAIGIPLGIVAGLRPGRPLDRFVRLFAGVGYSIPNFWLGIMLILALAVQRTWLPTSGFVRITDSPLEWLRYIALPALTLGYSLAALIARQLRAGLIDVLETNYIRAAWAHGIPRRTVIARHATKNAAIPLISTIGLQFGYLLGGTVIVEQIFAIPGLGTQMINSITSRDLPIIQGLVVIFVITQVLLSLLMDIGYAWVNPKVRAG